jgi:DNA-directed RNA polymerase specialized sigma subunit
MKNGLSICASLCLEKNIQCQNIDCRHWIEYEDEKNCSLISVYENGPMTLREIGLRLGISFARVKQIESAALKKIKKNRLVTEQFFGK